MTRIVTSHYRYQRPPRKRQAVALEVPAVVKAAEPVKDSKRAKSVSVPDSEAAAAPSNDGRKPPPPPAVERQSAIVTIRRAKHARLAHLLEDLTPEEHHRRGDAADALFREVVRRINRRS